LDPDQLASFSFFSLQFWANISNLYNNYLLYEVSDVYKAGLFL
jgi:hypothetical protein